MKTRLGTGIKLYYLVQRLSCSANAQELNFEFHETLCIYSAVGKNLFTLCIRKTDAKKSGVRFKYNSTVYFLTQRSI